MNSNSKKHSKVLILGSGPAGYTAAIYTARAMLKPILVHGSEPGGQMTTTTDVQNYPGYTDVIQGPWLMEQMKGQAKTVGTDMIQDHIKKVDLNKKPFKAIGDSGQEYTGDSIIISTGAQARWLNLKSEQEYRGFGVSGCATCDGFFFKDKEVAVIGGGNAAVEEAIFLTKFATKVKLIHRRDKLRAEKMLQKKLMENKKIEIIIAGAGGAAHLAGVAASLTTLPVLGVPIESKLKGLDSLLSTVQMPSGIPVGTLAIGKAGAINAALLAISILSVRYKKIENKLNKYRSNFEKKVPKKPF